MGAFICSVCDSWVGGFHVSGFNSCDVLAHNKRLFGVTFVIWPHLQSSLVRIYYTQILVIPARENELDYQINAE